MPVRERQMPYDFTCMLNIMNKLNNKQNTDRLRQRASGQPLVGGWEVKVVDGSSKKEGLMDMVDNVETAGGMQVGGGGERGTLLHCWWVSRLVQPLWKAVWRYLKKLRMDWPFDSVIPLLGILEETQNTNSQEH